MFCFTDYSLVVMAVNYCMSSLVVYCIPMILFSLCILLALCVQCFRFCEIFAVEYDVKFNAVKSVAMRIGRRFNVTCAPLMLGGMLRVSSILEL